MVVDALDLCYTKSHVDAFVIISGDSDFSPLVSKLRENNKTVIGVGVKKSTSDLLIANCDEFIFYDDLVRDQKPKRNTRKKTPEKSETVSAEKAEAAEKSEGAREQEPEAREEADRSQQAMDLLLGTIEGMLAERGEDERLWGSMVKQTMKRRHPGFNESYYGFRSFNNLLEEARSRKLLELELDEKSGGYLLRPVSAES